MLNKDFSMWIWERFLYFPSRTPTDELFDMDNFPPLSSGHLCCYSVSKMSYEAMKYLSLNGFLCSAFLSGLDILPGPTLDLLNMKLRDRPVMCLLDVTTSQHITEWVHWDLSTFFVSILCADTGKRTFCREHERCSFSEHLSNFRGKLAIFAAGFPLYTLAFTKDKFSHLRRLKWYLLGIVFLGN